MRSKIRSILFSDFFKYGMVSLIALIIDTSILTFCTETLKWGSVAAGTAGFSVGMIFVYIVSLKYIFGRSKYSKTFEITVFMLIGVVGLVINDVIIGTLTHFTSIYAAKFSAIFIVFTWNFLARKKLMTNKEIVDEQA